MQAASRPAAVGTGPAPGGSAGYAGSVEDGATGIGSGVEDRRELAGRLLAGECGPGPRAGTQDQRPPALGDEGL